MSDVSTKFGAGIFWSLLSRWGSKGIGLINTVVLARLLSPQDFGIVALGTLVLGIVESFTQIGLHLYVIRDETNDRRVVDAAWTIGFIQGLIISVILALSAPFVAVFFQTPEVENIVYCLAIVRLLQGTEGLGILLARKALNFTLDFQHTILTRLSYLITTISLALYLQSYWALVIGHLVSAAISVLLTYLLHTYRPRISFFQWRDIVSYSGATIPMSIGRYLNNKLDLLVIGRISDATFVGKYHMALELSTIFTRELLIPIIRGLLPNFAKLKAAGQLKDTFILTVKLSGYIFFPIGFGLAAITQEFTSIFLGSQWTDIAPLLMWLSLYGMLQGLMMFLSEQFLIILGKEHLSNYLMWWRVLTVSLAIVVSVTLFTVNEIPIALLLSGMASLPVVVYYVAKSIDTSQFVIYKCLSVPAVSSALMFLAIHMYSQSFEMPDFVDILLKIFLGALSYIVVLTIIYLVSGKPENSVETLVINFLRKKAIKAN